MEAQFNPNTLFKRDFWIVRTFYRVRHFFREKLGKWHRNVVMTAFSGEPWDHDYLFSVEHAKIKEMLEWHRKHGKYAGVEHNIRDMQICLSLIEIFTGKRDLFHFNGKLLSEPTGDGETYRVVESPDFEYVCDVYVNTKNIDRFVEDEKAKGFYLIHKDELYMLKARKLYHKIRFEKEIGWWE